MADGVFCGCVALCECDVISVGYEKRIIAEAICTLFIDCDFSVTFGFDDECSLYVNECESCGEVGC